MEMGIPNYVGVVLAVFLPTSIVVLIFPCLYRTGLLPGRRHRCTVSSRVKWRFLVELQWPGIETGPQCTSLLNEQPTSLLIQFPLVARRPFPPLLKLERKPLPQRLGRLTRHCHPPTTTTTTVNSTDCQRRNKVDITARGARGGG